MSQDLALWPGLYCHLLSSAGRDPTALCSHVCQGHVLEALLGASPYALCPGWMNHFLLRAASEEHAGACSCESGHTHLPVVLASITPGGARGSWSFVLAELVELSAPAPQPCVMAWTRVFLLVVGVVAAIQLFQAVFPPAWQLPSALSLMHGVS